MIIELKGKKYSTKFVSTRQYRTAVHLVREENLDDLTTEKMDKLVSFICDVFENQFSIDDFYDGFPAEDLEETIAEVLTYATTSKKNKIQLQK